MKVRLTERQHEKCRKMLTDERHLEIFDLAWEEATQGGTPANLVLPPDAWLLISERMFDWIYSPGGGRRPSVGSASVSAMRKVQTAINHRRLHPAYRPRVGVFDRQTELLPSWIGYTGAIEWRYAFQADVPLGMDWEYRTLVPSQTTWKHQAVWIWAPQEIPPSARAQEPRLDEAWHAPFYRPQEGMGGPDLGSTVEDG